MATEKRLIYLEDAVSLLEKEISENQDALKYAYHGDKEAIRSEISALRSAITILKQHANRGGAVEVVHGRWVYYSTTMQECSNCKRHTARHKFKHCPHCGAVMEDKYNEG